MTPEQLDHLRALDAHLTALLDLAAKRTPGDFSKTTTQHQQPGYPYAVIRYARGEKWNDVISAHVKSEGDAAFIAACAGRAEAGWRSTKATVAMLLEMEIQGCSFRYFPTVEDILAAWPRERLTLP